jgi:hypothetical protein
MTQHFVLLPSSLHHTALQSPTHPSNGEQSNSRDPNVPPEKTSADFQCDELRASPSGSAADSGNGVNDDDGRMSDDDQSCLQGKDGEFDEEDVNEPDADGVPEAPSQNDLDKESVHSASVLTSAGVPKKMKSASKSSQFYTTIVVTVCVSVRERLGFVSVETRARNIFKRVEIGLRDRNVYPMPQDVSIKDLMVNSFFNGADSVQRFQEYCVDCSRPLEKDMIALGDRLYNHKFTDIRRNLVTQVIPRFFDILEHITGKGTKSG